MHVSTSYDQSYALRTDEFATRPYWIEDLNRLFQAARIEEGDLVLDFGCSTGTAMQRLKTLHGAFPVGVETNPFSLAWATEKGLSVFNSIEKTPGIYDKVLLVHTLNHLPDPVAVLSAIRNKMVQGGVLGIINPNFWHHRLMFLSNLISGYRSDPTIVRRYTSSSLRNLLENAYFEVESLEFSGEPVGPTGVFPRMIVTARAV